MSDSVLVLLVAGAWLTLGVGLSLVMGRRGHDAFSWLILGTLLGPLAVVLAVSSWRTEERLGPVRVVEPGTGEGGAVDVLVGLDGSAQSRAAARAAVELFGPCLGRLTFATVVPFDGGREGERLARATLAAEASALAIPAAGLQVVHGRPAEALARLAREAGYDVLVVGTSGAGVSKRILGSATTGLARSSKVPVLLVGAV